MINAPKLTTVTRTAAVNKLNKDSHTDKFEFIIVRRKSHLKYILQG